MKEYLRNIKWKRWQKVALVIVPVVVWDVFYFVVKTLYEGCTVIDKKGSEFLANFVDG